jgi:deoxyxylulose-5-phosphate synthase
MGRRAKPGKAKVEDKRPAARKSLKNEGARVRDLEKRLAETQEHLTTATTMYREMGMTYWLEQARA